MDEDFSKLSKMFNAMRSIVRVPDKDPKYKIAVLASKQVCFVTLVTNLFKFMIKANLASTCRITA